MSQPRGQLLPLVVTCLGRTGSTWLLRLLGCHPEIVVYGAFEHEARLGSYWAAVFNTLTSVASVGQVLDPVDIRRPHWWVGPNLDATASLAQPTAAWMVNGHTRAVADFCRDRIDAFYREVAKAGPAARYFAEKYAPPPAGSPLAELYPDLQEIVLVRDFRDMIASALAFNEKRGFPAFGRENVASDEEYIRARARDVAMLQAHWERRGPAAHLVRYEELIRSPAATLARLLAALGLDATESVLSTVVAGAGEDHPAMPFHRTVPDAESSIGRWRDLPLSLAELANAELAAALQEFGYHRDEATRE